MKCTSSRPTQFGSKKIVAASHVESKVGTRRDMVVGHADTTACDRPPAEDGCLVECIGKVVS
jgi:hypothetical protein